MIYIVAIFAVIFSFYGGIVIGVHDCKRRFGIPKGVQSFEEWSNYCVKECEDFINE